MLCLSDVLVALAAGLAGGLVVAVLKNLCGVNR